MSLDIPTATSPTPAPLCRTSVARLCRVEARGALSAQIYRTIKHISGGSELDTPPLHSESGQLCQDERTPRPRTPIGEPCPSAAGSVSSPSSRTGAPTISPRQMRQPKVDSKPTWRKEKQARKVHQSLTWRMNLRPSHGAYQEAKPHT